jgi:SOS response regulatory protein OraA/RecX
MDFSDTELIKQAIVSAEGNKSDTEIKKTLLQQGFQEKDITKAFDEIKKDDQKAGKRDQSQ